MSTSKVKHEVRAFQTTVFHCDHPECTKEFDSCRRMWKYATFQAKEAGWAVRKTTQGWKHFCPNHKRLYPFRGEHDPPLYPALINEAT